MDFRLANRWRDPIQKLVTLDRQQRCRPIRPGQHDRQRQPAATCSRSVADSSATLTITIAKQGGDRVSVHTTGSLAAQSTPRLTTATGNFLMFVDSGGTAVVRSGPNVVNGLITSGQATFAAVSASGQPINAMFNLAPLNAMIAKMRAAGC